MKSLEYYVDQMNQLLTNLNEVAAQLRDVSLQVISEEELIPLQKRQDELLAALEEVDQQLYENYSRQLDAATQQKFHDQLHRFQELNQEFVRNLDTSHGLIQFELQRLHEEEEFPRYHRIKKVTPNEFEEEEFEEEVGEFDEEVGEEE